MAIIKEDKEVTNKPNARFITSFALAVVDMDGDVRHIQISIVQEEESKVFRAFMDVVDPSKIRLQEPKE